MADDPLIPLVSAVPTGADHDSARAFIDMQIRMEQDGDGWAWAVTKPRGEEPVGYVGAMWLGKASGRASIGYWTEVMSRGQGLTSDAVSVASDWLLAEGGVARLEAYIEPSNVASIQVAQRAGFEREGLMRSFVPVGSRRADVLLYARIRE